MTRMTGPDCAVLCNLINIHTYLHTYIYTYIGLDCVVMCNLINTYIHTYIHTYIQFSERGGFVRRELNTFGRLRQALVHIQTTQTMLSGVVLDRPRRTPNISFGRCG